MNPFRKDTRSFEQQALIDVRQKTEQFVPNKKSMNTSSTFYPAGWKDVVQDHRVNHNEVKPSNKMKVK